MKMSIDTSTGDKVLLVSLARPDGFRPVRERGEHLPRLSTSSCSEALAQTFCVSEAVGLVSPNFILFYWISHALSVTYNML